MRNDDTARCEDACLVVRIFDVPLDWYQSFAEFLQLFEHLRRFVGVVWILPATLDRLGRGHPRGEILEGLLEDTYFLKSKQKHTQLN